MKQFTKAQDQAKSHLSCTLISTAASHCRILGHGGESTYRTGNEVSRRLFWTTYVSEKHASLLFGRASSIQENDIDVAYPALSEDPLTRPWDELFIMGIKFAQIQGQIYDRLYSTCALKMSIPERTRKINALVPDLKRWYTDLKQVWHFYPIYSPKASGILTMSCLDLYKNNPCEQSPEFPTFQR